MKLMALILTLGFVTACGLIDTSVVSRVANFQGTDLEIEWSSAPADSEAHMIKAAIISTTQEEDTLPVDSIKTEAFRNFFSQVTGCEPLQHEPFTVYKNGRRPAVIIFPYACP